MMKTKWFAVAVLGLVPWLAGCDDEDLTSIRVSINADGSGTIMASAVAVPEEPTGIERGTVGATWSDRVTVTAATGTFETLSQLVVADISFSQVVSASGIVTLAVVLPLGAEAQWTKMISPMSQAQREESARAFDRDGKIKSLGSKLKLVIELPNDVVGNGVTPRLSGVSPSNKDNVAELLIPVDTALEATGSLQWLLTWIQ